MSLPFTEQNCVVLVRAMMMWVVARWLLSGCLLAQVNKKIHPQPSLYDILVPSYSSDSSFNVYRIFFFLNKM